MEWQDRARWLGLPVLFTRYWLFGETIYRRRGLLFVTEDRLPLYRVLDIRVQKSLFERLLGLGSVILYAADVTDRELVLRSIKRPDDVAELIQDRVNELRRVYNVRGREMYGALSGGWSSQTENEHML